MNEIWKPMKDYEGYYEVSNKGRIKSLERKQGNRMLKEKILKLPIYRTGYPYVFLSKNGKNKKYTIHRLVAEAFIPNPENKPVVNHIDSVRDNNFVENLEWATVSENMFHAYTLGGQRKNKRPVAQYSRDGLLIRKFESIIDAANYLGKRPSDICGCCKGRLPTAFGYKWKYI